MKIVIYFLIFFLLICIIYCIIYCKKYNENENYNKSKCWKDSFLYPEAKIFFDKREIIKKEMMNIINTNKWSIWSNDYNTTPIFSRMSNEQIKKRLNNMTKIDNNGDWKIFGLILNKEILPNAYLCPKTIEILMNNSKKILNAGFSVLESKCNIGEHKDFNNTYYRLHIPLLIPKKNIDKNKIFINKEESKELCVMQVENDYRLWQENDYFIFDDTCLHNAWNNTDEIRIVLLIDLLK